LKQSALLLRQNGGKAKLGALDVKVEISMKISPTPPSDIVVHGRGEGRGGRKKSLLETPTHLSGLACNDSPLFEQRRRKKRQSLSYHQNHTTTREGENRKEEEGMQKVERREVPSGLLTCVPR